MAGLFRNDINALRAYALLAVMFYHFGIAALPGGFVGVDVFFVISGLLMTQIIVVGIRTQTFSLGNFYLSRARRIIPALAVLCLALLLFGSFWLAPSDYVQLGEHVAGAISFSSNFVFKDESGYFDAPSKTKWLLHSWSLSVEWQFYLLYPLLLLGFRRFVSSAEKQIVWFLAGLALLSLLACALVSPRDNGFAFYMLPTRAWEMLLGGLVFFAGAPSARWARALEWLGMLLMITAATTFTAEMAWPGLYALLPTLGAALVLLAARQDSLFSRARAIQALGRWSYSIYLWHWPLVVGLGYFALKDSPVAVAVAIIASILLGAISCRVVEQPARRYFGAQHWRMATAATLLTMVGLAAAGAGISQLNGLPSRVSDEILAMDRESENHFPFPPHCGFSRKTSVLTPCVIGDAPIRWVVLGDSHAGAILGAVHAALPGGIHYYAHQCVTIFNSELKSKNARNHCTEFMRAVKQQVDALPPNVGIIVINRYSANTRGPNEGDSRPWGIRYLQLSEAEKEMDADTLYQHRLSDTLCTLAKGHSVAAVLPIPEMGVDVPKMLVRARMAGRDLRTVALPLAAYRARHEVAVTALKHARATCGVTLLDPVHYLCDQTQCYGAADAKSRYFDDDHLSESGNRLLVPLFRTLKH